MPKYKNVKEFVQPLTVNGKRIIVRPGEVVDLQKELDLSYTPFLEKVGDATPVSKLGVAKTTTKSPDIDHSQLDQLKTVADELKTSLDNHVTKEDLKKHTGSLEEKMKDLFDGQAIISKRMEVLKTAVETVNQALRNIEEVVYNSEEFVIEDDHDHKP